jgi:putative SOS response-associated peptidase YedK
LVPDAGTLHSVLIPDTDASPDVALIHPDDTPVLLFDEAAREQWMNAPMEEALLLRKPPPAGVLSIVKIDRKEDGGL